MEKTVKNNENEIKALLKELECLLSDVGWSKKELAEKICRSGKVDNDANSEYEIIRKLFTRPPKKRDKLDQYIQFIVNHRENKNKHFYKIVRLEPKNEQEKVFLEKIREISLEVLGTPKESS